MANRPPAQQANSINACCISDDGTVIKSGYRRLFPSSGLRLLLICPPSIRPHAACPPETKRRCFASPCRACPLSGRSGLERGEALCRLRTGWTAAAPLSSASRLQGSSAKASSAWQTVRKCWRRVPGSTESSPPINVHSGCSRRLYPCLQVESIEEV